MRLLKAILTLAAGCGLMIGGGTAGAQTKQPAPAPTPTKTAAPAKQAPVPSKQSPAPAKQSTAPAKTTPAPAKKSAPAKAPASQAPTTAPAGKAPSGQAAAAQTKVDADMPVGNRRDPFAALVAGRGRGPQRAPEITCRAPGKGSVAIDTMRVDGVVRQGNTMIAAVRTPQGRVYFLRERDQLCDGRVERITMSAENVFLTLRQTGRDAFGKPVDRLVNKPMLITKPVLPSAGEQQ